MKTRCLLFLIAATTWSFLAQGAYAPARPTGPQGPQVTSPELAPIYRVTFRILAPKAESVRLVAGDIPGLTQTAALAIYDAVQVNDAPRAGWLTLWISVVSVLALVVVLFASGFEWKIAQASNIAAMRGSIMPPMCPSSDRPPVLARLLWQPTQ